MAHIKDWMALADPDPEWTQAVNEKMGGHEPDLGIFPDIPSMRSWITESKKAMAAQMGPQPEGVKEHDEEVTMRDGAKIVCRIHAPEKAPEGGSPLAVIYHGGGWCIGGLENEELLCRLLASRLGVTCVNVDYRLAPEHKFPTAIHDCHDATKWVHASQSRPVITALTASPGRIQRLLPRRRPKQRLYNRRHLSRRPANSSNVPHLA